MPTLFGRIFPAPARRGVPGRRSAPRPGANAGSESDVARDQALVTSRAEGGDGEHRSDAGSVTGTARTGVFVGQIAGDDLGYAQRTGAETRATGTPAASTPAAGIPAPGTPTDGAPARATGGDGDGSGRARPRPDQQPRVPVEADTGPGPRVVLVHRVGALLVAATIATFGALGLAGGLGFFSTRGQSIAGLSSNGLLSTVSLVTAAVLVAAAVRGGRTASSVMLVVGGLFLVSAFANLAVLDTSYNLLAFRLPNVFFSIGAGLVLLITGAYGRLAGKMPADNPYLLAGDRLSSAAAAAPAQSAQAAQPDDSQPRPHTRDEAAADQAMAAAERAVAGGVATPDQGRRVAAMDPVRTHEDRRRVWMNIGPAEVRPAPPE